MGWVFGVGKVRKKGGAYTGIQNGSGAVTTTPNHSNLWEPRDQS